MRVDGDGGKLGGSIDCERGACHPAGAYRRVGAVQIRPARVRAAERVARERLFDSDVVESDVRLSSMVWPKYADASTVTACQFPQFMQYWSKIFVDVAKPEPEST